MIRKTDIELSISRNFNKVTVSVKDEPIDYSGEDDFALQVADIMDNLMTIIDSRFEKLK